MDCEATIVDGNLVGKMVTPRGEREFTAKRVAAAPSFIGEWSIELNFGDRQVQAKLDIDQVDGALTGIWSSQFGDTKLDNVSVKGDTITFSRTMERQGQEFTIDSEATIEDGKLVGQMITPRGEMPFTGTAVAQQDEGGDEATRLLKEMDANGDGKVTEDEAPEGMKPFFSGIDANGDGGLDSTEMQTVVEYRRSQGR